MPTIDAFTHQILATARAALGRQNDAEQAADAARASAAAADVAVRDEQVRYETLRNRAIGLEESLKADRRELRDLLAAEALGEGPSDPKRAMLLRHRVERDAAGLEVMSERATAAYDAKQRRELQRQITSAEANAAEHRAEASRQQFERADPVQYGLPPIS